MTTFGEYWSLPGVTATATLAAKQYYAVITSTTAGQVKIAASPTDVDLIGIVQNAPTAGQAADVAILGLAKAKAGGVVAVGSYVTTNTTGEIVATTSANNKVLGKAVEAAADGDIFRVLVCPSNY